MKRLIAVAAVALALAAPAGAVNGYQSMMDGDEGGGGTWSTMPCDEYYFGWIVTLEGRTAVCVNNGVYWVWYPIG